MLLAASESAVTKKPRLRLTMRRSSSVSPLGSFHSAMSRLIWISCGIQWFAHAERYFSHAHWYLNGTSWLTSVDPLMTRLSATLTRLIRSSPAGCPAGPRAACGDGVASVAPCCSSNCSICQPPFIPVSRIPVFRAPRPGTKLLARLALGVVDRAEFRVARRRGERAVGIHGVELAGGDGGLLRRGRAQRAQVVGRLEPADPGELVGLVELLARRARHVDVERLRLVHPLLAPRRALDQPLGLDLEGGGVESADLRWDAVDLGERAVEVLEVRDHHLVPQVELLQVPHQELVRHRELARQVRFDIEVLVGGLDALREAGDVGDRRRGRDGEAVGVAHADLLDALLQ